MPSAPICDNYVVTTGSEESLSLVTTTAPLVAQSPALDPAPPACTSTDQDNILTNPIDIDNESSNSDDDDSTAKRPWINNPPHKTCGNSPGKRKSKSDRWNHIKMLQKDHEKVCSYTHICIVDGCGTLIKLLNLKTNHTTLQKKAFDHVRNKHDTIDLDGKHVSEKNRLENTCL